jgi:hypothetical protein
MNMKMKYPIVGLILMLAACAGGEDKREGTDDRPQSSVGTTFENDTLDRSATTGTAPPGDTAGVNARTGSNDQTGPTGSGKGKDGSHPDAPAY